MNETYLPGLTVVDPHKISIPNLSCFDPTSNCEPPLSIQFIMFPRTTRVVLGPLIASKSVDDQKAPIHPVHTDAGPIDLLPHELL
jgi:hypothetical protein